MTDDALRTDGTGDRVVFTFHGPGRGPDQFHAAAQTFMPEAHVISPAGDVPEANGTRFLQRTDADGYDMEDLAARTAAMARFVAAETARVGADRATGIGYGDGASVLAAVAIHDPALFDTLALLHPLLPWTPEPEPRLAETRVLITGGRADPQCPEETTRGLADWFAGQMADVTVAWHPGGHEIPQSEVEALRDFLG